MCQLVFLVWRANMLGNRLTLTKLTIPSSPRKMKCWPSPRSTTVDRKIDLLAFGDLCRSASVRLTGVNIQTKVPILATHVDMNSNTMKMSSIPGQRVTKYLTYNRESVQTVVISYIILVLAFFLMLMSRPRRQRLTRQMITKV